MEITELDGLLAGLAETPARLAARARPFGAGQLRRRGADDGFSLLEHVWHLADVEERAFAVRIRRIRDEPAPELADFDGAAAASAGRYHERELDAGLAAFTRARAGNLAVLRALGAADWDRPARQEGVGALTLGDLPRLMAGHDAAHALELDALRAEFIQEALATTPARLGAELGRFGPGALRRIPPAPPADAELFAPIGHACHLRDIEHEGYRVRIRRVREETAPFLESLPSEQMAVDRRYEVADSGAVVAAFGKARAATLATLRGVDAREWSRTAEFEGYGPVTLLGLIAILEGHDAAHLRALAVLPG